MTTIGEAISRVRNILKAVKEDPFLTDRFIYSEIIKYGKLLIKRQDSLNQILKFQSFFKTLPCVELIDVDRVEACCAGVKSNVTFKRTKDKLPRIMEGPFGPLFRTISSIDGSENVYITQPAIFQASRNTSGAKYDKKKYYWYINDYIYVPNVDWDALSIEGIFEDDISIYQCTTEEQKCAIRQSQALQIPDFLLAEIEQMVVKDMSINMQVPVDMAADDKQNVLR
jgi:hypothetical protein